MTVPPTEPPEVQYDNLQLQVNNQSSLEGEVTVYLGSWFPCGEAHPEFCTADNKSSSTLDDRKYIVTVAAEKLKQARPQPLRPDIFVAGNYSLLDVMMYVSDIRDDFQIELTGFDESIGTHKFLVSWDVNGDGQFSAEGDGADNYRSPDWYPRWGYASELKREIGPVELEAHYRPADELIVAYGTEIRFEPHSSAMTQRREQLQRQQVARRARDGGALVIPEFQVNLKDGRGYVTLAKDIKVRHFNIRDDLFQKDVYTLADFFMTLHYDYGFNLEFTYWPTLSTNARVNAFAVTQFEGRAANALYGWAYQVGEIASERDFFFGSIGKVEVPLETILENKDGTFCPWLGEMDLDKAKICQADWNDVFGGNKIHQMSDHWVLNATPEMVQLQWHNIMPGLWGTPQPNVVGDGKQEVYDSRDAIKPLTDSHFGWKIADCSQCHALERTHLQGDSPILPANLQPHYCASCHGSNGATPGHGETARCSWCHSQDKAMINHGTASNKYRLSQLTCPDGEAGPCANAAALLVKPHDAAGNGEGYADEQLTSSNSLWHTDEQFPEPYACVSCHTTP
ncbi:hypothetical protein [Ferrimonas sp. SCSIO 43195]|uniref:hypothetical protein n=1 Tax=Ferrimonas sp. SCSIO 43195 TaxID=2822844 RepID=UPI0020761DBB|nr:hypothetical protein [Ferrimonas sp. SCSIO 43195]USD36795.1 hypothetical protein J8Z22_17590 [Ferrimonas sp. SCSIO 43195]